MDIAAQLGHNPTVCLDTYAHLMAEKRGWERVGAEQIALARGLAWRADEERGDGPQLAFEDLEGLSAAETADCAEPTPPNVKE